MEVDIVEVDEGCDLIPFFTGDRLIQRVLVNTAKPTRKVDGSREKQREAWIVEREGARGGKKEKKMQEEKIIFFVIVFDCIFWMSSLFLKPLSVCSFLCVVK